MSMGRSPPSLPMRENITTAVSENALAFASRESPYLPAGTAAGVKSEPVKPPWLSRFTPEFL